MAAPTALPELLEALTSSISSTLDITPKLVGLGSVPVDGISLLDAKNELMLSYLQNLVFLILVKLRQLKAPEKGHKDHVKNLDDLVVRKLVELRLYLDKGVRPLEDKLRYQVDKVLRAAEDAERNAQASESNKVSLAAADAVSSSDSDDDHDDDDDDDNVKHGVRTNMAAADRQATDLMNRPRISAFVRPSASATIGAAGKEEAKSGAYRPPRLNPTVMPSATARQDRAQRRPMKSATLDEYIADEMSAAPLAVPSIGTTIAAGGRATKTSAERKMEEERREYEEGNFIRLPAESKKERAKRTKLEGRSSRMNYGGEEWRDLTEGVDRIDRLTKSKNAGGGTRTLLENSRKRGIETIDGKRGSGVSEGVQMGERFQKRLKTLDAGRRDRGKNR